MIEKRNLWPHNLQFLGLGVVLFLALFGAACSGPANGEPTPPIIHYSEDICEFCGMIVSEERYAAGYLTEDGQEHIFDDIGDMIQAHLNTSPAVTAAFVHDHDNHTWIRAESAYFMMSQDLPTPMLSGLAAFASAEAAQEMAARRDGQVLTFQELLQYYRNNPPTPVFAGLERN